jgi:hypothetical protein
VPDVTPPSCALTDSGTDPLGNSFIEITIQDTQSGLCSILVTKSTNALTVVPPFAPGTTDPVVIRSTKIDQSETAEVAVEGTDCAGNTCSLRHEF